MPNYKSRYMRHEGGSLTAKPMPPRSYQREIARAEEERRLMEEMQAQRAYEERLAQIMEMEGRDAIPERLEPLPPEPMESQYADRLNAAMQRYRRERGLMELGNRQRAAAARARARSRRGPTAAERARNMAEYERAMRARQANLSRGSTPSPRPVPQPRPNPRPAPPSPVMNRQQYQQELQNRIAARPPATSINVGGGKALPAIPNPNYRPPVRPNPTVRDPSLPRDRNPVLNNPNISAAQRRENSLTALGNRQRAAANRFSVPRAPRNVSRPMPYMGSEPANPRGERQRIQQQIAQLQARLRQLGG